jgi:hypothetical protein
LAVSSVPRAALTGRAPVVKSAGAMWGSFVLWASAVGLGTGKRFCIN